MTSVNDIKVGSWVKLIHSSGAHAHPTIINKLLEEYYPVSKVYIVDENDIVLYIDGIWDGDGIHYNPEYLIIKDRDIKDSPYFYDI